ncbi:GNAT family N-acetyltransferase [Novosphingobium sp. ZN18A2]|uniref:GNAT family N-acetyltransferase n=1 Tax=Novosphingobium sp. ZN18A2 TaxID=3079861 RepID=UPI0030CB72E8
MNAVLSCDAAGYGGMTPANSMALLPLAALGADDLAAWDRLATGAGTGNVFSRPWFLRHSLACFDPKGEARLAVARDASGEWTGVIPLVFARLYGRAPLPHWSAWRHANQFVGTPLVRRGCEGAFWSALLAFLDKENAAAAALRLFDLPADDPVNAALSDCCRSEGREFHVDHRFERAMLACAGQAPEPRPKDRRRLASLRRKLEREVGPVEFIGWRQGDDVPALVGQFLALEHSGWKGLQGSSLTSSEDTGGFFASVMASAASEGTLDALTLRAGGVPLAMSTHFVGPMRGFGFKMAYDEAFGCYAPGVLLLDELTRRFAELGVPQVDSCSAPGQQPVSRMWPGRRTLVEGRVALGGPLRRAAFRAFGTVEDLRGRVRAGAAANA